MLLTVSTTHHPAADLGFAGFDAAVPMEVIEHVILPVRTLWYALSSAPPRRARSS